MSLRILDTDHVTLHQHDHPVLQRRLAAANARDFSVTIVTAEEQLRGWLRLIRRARSQERLVTAYQSLRVALDYFAGVRLLDFDAAAATRFEELRKRKLRVGTRDLRIGATVLAVGGVLLSRNRRDFGQIPDLVIEDWTTVA